MVYPDRIGSRFALTNTNSSRHNWYYYPEMTMDECLMFTCCSAAPSFTMHAPTLPIDFIRNMRIGEIVGFVSFNFLHHVTFQSCPFFLYSNHEEFLRWACNFYWILCWLLKQLIANHISQWKKRPHLNLNCCDSHTYEWTMLWSARRMTNESPWDGLLNWDYYICSWLTKL